MTTKKPNKHNRQISTGFCLFCAFLWLFPSTVWGEHAIADAVKKKDLQNVRALVADRLDVNEPQPDGATALHWAAYWDDVETAQMLIRAGANADPKNDYGVTPLMLAC